MSGLPALALACVFPTLVIWAALKDATTMTIPNRLTLLIAAAFAPAALMAGLTPAAWGLALAVGAAALLAGMIMFAFGWVGGGDAKLFAACGLWVGLSAAAPFLLWTAITGGVLAAALIFGRRATGYLPGFGPAWLRRLLAEGEGVPYGVAIAAGALAAFPQSPVGAALQARFTI